MLRNRADDDAGGGGVSVEFALLVDNSSFRRRGAAANMNDVCFATDQARFRGHGPYVVDLDLQGRVSRSRGKS